MEEKETMGAMPEAMQSAHAEAEVKETVSFGAAIIIIAVQCLFHLNCRIFRTKKYFQIKICFINGGEECGKVKELFQTDRFNRLIIERKGGETLYHATLNTDEEYSSAQLQEIMKENPFIKSIERCDEG